MNIRRQDRSWPTWVSESGWNPSGFVTADRDGYFLSEAPPGLSLLASESGGFVTAERDGYFSSRAPTLACRPTIDVDGAGHGWCADSTPADEEMKDWLFCLP